MGYGGRGARYAKYAIDNPDELEITGVAEPVENKREYAKKLHNLSDSQVFEDWKQIAALPKMADFAIIATQDNMHCEPALKYRRQQSPSYPGF